MRPNRENEPRFLIPNRYMKLLDDPLTDQETREYILKNLKSLMEIRKAIADRESTIVRIAKVIADQQYDFFDLGPEHLRPMTMRDVADRLGVHETTVSRAVSGKYLRSPVGIFEFKYFFSAGLRKKGGGSGDGAEAVSNRAVMEKIAAIVKGEDSNKPYSDQAITDMLVRSGVDIKRRTVAKYRESLHIPTAAHRRRATT